jgi:hypothetical protein
MMWLSAGVRGLGSASGIANNGQLNLPGEQIRESNSLVPVIHRLGIDSVPVDESLN